jgi:hypothetical protein
LVGEKSVDETSIDKLSPHRLPLPFTSALA